jgi:broad specificity phosphatase PhoE
VARFLLIRHAESEGNRDQVFTATPLVGLTDRGRQQARAAAEWIRGRHAPALVVSSPFVRARQTADILADALEVPVVIEDDLRERDYGTLAARPTRLHAPATTASATGSGDRRAGRRSKRCWFASARRSIGWRLRPVTTSYWS